MSIWDGKGKGSGNAEFLKKGEKKNEVSTSSVIVVDCTRIFSPSRKTDFDGTISSCISATETYPSPLA